MWRAVSQPCRGRESPAPRRGDFPLPSLTRARALPSTPNDPKRPRRPGAERRLSCVLNAPSSTPKHRSAARRAKSKAVVRRSAPRCPPPTLFPRSSRSHFPGDGLGRICACFKLMKTVQLRGDNEASEDLKVATQVIVWWYTLPDWSKQHMYASRLSTWFARAYINWL